MNVRNHERTFLVHEKEWCLFLILLLVVLGFRTNIGSSHLAETDSGT